MQKRIAAWLSKDNLQQAKGKKREQILLECGNKLEPIAHISPEYLPYLGENINDNRVYSGKGYFIDHAANHHPEVPVGDYQNIQDILNNPDDVLLDNSKTQNALVFIKKYKNTGTVVVGVNKTNSGMLMLYKSFFNQRKNSYAKYRSVRVIPSLVGGHSTISPAENPAAASALSGRNDNAKIMNNF